MTMKFVVVGLAATAVLAAGPALADPNLQIKDAALRVVVVPENRADVVVDVYRPNSDLPLHVTKLGDDVVIDGGLTGFLTTCHGSGAGLHAFIFGKGDFAVSQFPQVLVHTPMNVRVSAGGIVQGSIAHGKDVSLRHGGCGDWTVANASGELQADVAGVGDIRAGTAHSADLTLSGTGHISAVAVDAQLTARVSGSGDIGVQTAGAADLTITGSGSIKTGPIAGGLSAVISGAGSLNVASLNGPFTAHVSGVGSVDAPAGHATSLTANVSGSGSVKFGGVADSVDANVSGVGSVDVAKVTGPVNQHVSGVGSVHIGH